MHRALFASASAFGAATRASASRPPAAVSWQPGRLASTASSSSSSPAKKAAAAKRGGTGQEPARASKAKAAAATTTKPTPTPTPTTTAAAAAGSKKSGSAKAGGSAPPPPALTAAGAAALADAATSDNENLTQVLKAMYRQRLARAKSGMPVDEAELNRAVAERVAEVERDRALIEEAGLTADVERNLEASEAIEEHEAALRASKSRGAKAAAATAAAGDDGDESLAAAFKSVSAEDMRKRLQNTPWQQLADDFSKFKAPDAVLQRFLRRQGIHFDPETLDMTDEVRSRTMLPESVAADVVDMLQPLIKRHTGDEPALDHLLPDEEDVLDSPEFLKLAEKYYRAKGLWTDADEQKAAAVRQQLYPEEAAAAAAAAAAANTASSSSSSSSSSAGGDSVEALLKELKFNETEAAVASELPTGRHNLRFWSLYPSEIKQWIADARTPIGSYAFSGTWQPEPTSEQARLEEHATLIRDASGIGMSLAEVQQRRWMKLPADLEGQYRFGITEDDLKAANVSAKVREILTFRYARPSEILAFRVARSIANWQLKSNDTGNAAIQATILTHRIWAMTEHMKQHYKDQTTKRGLIKLISRRAKVFKYLKRTNVARYYEVLKQLGLRDAVA